MSIQPVETAPEATTTIVSAERVEAREGVLERVLDRPVNRRPFTLKPTDDRVRAFAPDRVSGPAPAEVEPAGARN